MAAAGSNSASEPTILLGGATGLVGRSILEGLLADRSVRAIHAVGRRKPDVVDARLVFHAADFASWRAPEPLDEVYLALGTTIKAAGSEAAFRAIDFDANLALARAAIAAGARRCGLVSSMGADAKSRFFYNRVKGELEEALAQLPFEGLVIARPSLLLGNRQALGQPERPLERAFELVSKPLSALIPAGIRPIAAEKVARALLVRVPLARGRQVLSSAAMQG